LTAGAGGTANVRYGEPHAIVLEQEVNASQGTIAKHVLLTGCFQFI
jgi:hypothetical protein